jgi:predicted O-methyltransferase YrrM
VTGRPATTTAGPEEGAGPAVDDRVLTVARSTRGFMPDAEGAALHRAARVGAALGPLVEVGSYCGKSTVLLGAAARDAGTVCFTVDHHRGSEELQPGWEHHDPTVVDPHTGRIDTLPFLRRAVEHAGLEDSVVVVVGDSATVAAHWATALGMVFVDGGHGEGPAHADYEGWAPHVVVDGVLAIHDVFADPADGGGAPHQVYRRALASGAFVEDPRLGTGSLRVLRRAGAGR